MLLAMTRLQATERPRRWALARQQLDGPPVRGV